MIHEHDYNGFIYQQELMESWQKHEYVKELYLNLKYELTKINWVKLNYCANQKYYYNTYKNNYNKRIYTEHLFKHIEEINNIIRKLKIVQADAEIQRAENIKQLTNKLIKQIK